MDIKGSSIANDEGSMVGANGKVTKRATIAIKGTKKDLLRIGAGKIKAREQVNKAISKKTKTKKQTTIQKSRAKNTKDQRAFYVRPRTYVWETWRCNNSRSKQTSTWVKLLQKREEIYKEN